MRREVNDLSWLKTSVEINDLTLAILPPGELDVEMTFEKTVLDFNILPISARFAMGADKYCDSFHPSDSMAVYMRGLDAKLIVNNPAPGLLVEVGDETIDKWLGLADVTTWTDGVHYETDLVGSKIAQAAMSELYQSGPTEFSKDVLTIEAIILALSARFMKRVTGCDETSGRPVVKTASRPMLTDLQFKRARDFILDNLNDPKLSITDVAREAGRSSSHFADMFKERLGVTPYNFILQTRVERARLLVAETTLPLSEVAYRCGFSDQAHMTATFRKRLGITPGKLRKAESARFVAPIQMGASAP